MDVTDKHAAQYASLRAEVMDLVAETRKLEILVLGAIAGIYAWLATSKEPIKFSVWFLCVPLVILAGSRALALFHRIQFIAEYLRQIEERFFGDDPKLPGYERYFAKATSGRIAPTAAAFWLGLLLVTLLAPFLLAH